MSYISQTVTICISCGWQLVAEGEYTFNIIRYTIVIQNQYQIIWVTITISPFLTLIKTKCRHCCWDQPLVPIAPSAKPSRLGISNSTPYFDSITLPSPSLSRSQRIRRKSLSKVFTSCRHRPSALPSVPVINKAPALI